jgi:hypothetical protein
MTMLLRGVHAVIDSAARVEGLMFLTRMLKAEIHLKLGILKPRRTEKRPPRRLEAGDDLAPGVRPPLVT